MAKANAEVMKLSYNQIKNDPELLDYFQRLPIMLQETIAQSGASFSNIQELKKVVWDAEKFQDDGAEKR